ncbi:TPA: DUF2953 domain-containing protein [Methanosarcinaceae archaeon]|nr:DUF2953 domain-containing protein [Methanosarcinaceae archaeon]
MLALYAISILLLLVLFVLITPIELTLDAEVRRREGESLLRGNFAVKWLFFSRKVSIKKPETKESDDRSEKGKKYERKDETEIEIRKEIEREKDKEIEKRKIKGIEKGKEEKIWTEKGRGTEKKVEGIEKEIKEKIEEEKGKEKEKKVEGIEKEIEETKESKKFWKKEYSYILRAFRCLSEPLFRLFSDTLNALKVKHLDVDFTFGLPDPADTGMLCGVAHSLVGVLHGRCRQCSVYINPVFLDPVLDFRGNTKISIKIYSLVFSFIKFILNRKTLCFTYSIIKEWLQGKLKAHSQAL